MRKTDRTSALLVALVIILWGVSGVGAATVSGEDDRMEGGIAEAATGHGDDVTDATTLGDRDAHNVEINATVRDPESTGNSISETATGHGDRVTEALSSGDRDAHNVEINATVRET